MKERSKSQRSISILIATVIIVALIGIVLPLSVSADDNDLPFIKYDNVVISYSTAEFEPDDDADLTFAGVLTYLHSLAPDANWVMAFRFYMCNQGHYVVAESKHSTAENMYGYIIWRDDTGAYQHFMWKVGDGTESDVTPVPDDVINTDCDPVTLSGAEFKQICDRLEQQYNPKNTIKYISWRNDLRYKDTGDNYVSPRLTWFNEGEFCGQNWKEVYMVPFYTDGTDYYYSYFQYHYYQKVEQDSDGKNIISLYVDVWNMSELEPTIETLQLSVALTEIRYIDICLLNEPYRFSHVPYVSATAYYTKNRVYVWSNSNPLASTTTPQTAYLCSDKLTVANMASNLSPGNHFCSSVSTHDESCSQLCDMGFYVSDSAIEMDFGDFDYSQLADDDVVTLSGDTFYDYTITNTTTGDTTTINNYINNNYNYPASDTDNGGEGGSSSAGGTGGNVNVSGDISVGGQVDVNVNIEQSGSGASSDFLLPADEYAQYLPEVAPEVSEYLETTYSFLPPEIVGLLIGGIGAAVLCRILGR